MYVYSNSDVPVEKLGGRDLNENLKAQARRKVPESKLKTGMLDPIEVLSSPIQESEWTITLLTETVGSSKKISMDTEGPKEGFAGDDYSAGCHPRPLLSHLSPPPPPPPTPKDAVEYSNTQIDKVILVLWIYSKKL